MKHYGKLAFLGTMTLLCTQASAAPLSFSHSGVLRENGSLVNGERNFTAVIYDKESGGEVGRLENKTLNVVDGVYALTIDNIDEALVAVSNGLELELQIGADEPMKPRFTINSVPFAISANHARNADEATVAKSVDCEECVAMAQLDSNIQNTLENALSNNTKYALSSTVGGDALKAISADLKIATTDKTNGDSIQIGSGTAINIVNAQHAAAADSATKATNANLKIATTDKTNGDKIQIGSGTAINIVNAQHAAAADSATKATKDGDGNTISSTYLKTGTGTVTTTNIANNTITMDDINSSVILPRAYATLKPQRKSDVYSVPLENNKNITKVTLDSTGLYTVTINANAKLSGTNYHVQISPYLEINSGNVSNCGIREIKNISTTQFTFQTVKASMTAPISIEEGPCYWGGYNDPVYMPISIIIFQ